MDFTQQEFYEIVKLTMRIERINVMKALMMVMSEYGFTEHHVEEMMSPILKRVIRIYANSTHLLKKN